MAWTAVLAAATLAGGGAGDPATRPTAPAATQPATRPALADVKLSDAEPLADAQGEDDQVNLTDKLSAPQVSGTVYFGEVDTYGDGDDEDPTAAKPVVAVKRDGDWRAVVLAGPGLTDAGWKYVGAGPRPREVWGVLDKAAGADRSEFVVAHSTDGGQSFHLRAFRKPTKRAAVYDFALSRDGTGRVTLSLEADVGRHKAGLYHYETTDGGATWAEQPRFEADAMIRADSVDDAEQPDAPPADGKGKARFDGSATVRPISTRRGGR